MTNRPPFVVIILVIIVCFALGVLNVLITKPEEPSPSSYTPSPTQSVSTDASIQSILLVGVDELHSRKPKLRAIWIASYRSTEKVIYLHGVRIDTPIPGDEKTGLDELFAWSSQSGLGQDFLSGLYKILPLQANLTILLDDIAFSSLVDYLGGVDIRGKTIDGESVLTFLSVSWDQPQLLLENQANIVRSLIPKALNQPESPELTELFGLIPSHAYLSMDISEVVALFYPLRDTDPDSIFLILPEDTSENP